MVTELGAAAQTRWAIVLGALVLLLVLSTLSSDELIFWDDNRFYLGPTLAGLKLGTCIRRGWSTPVFEAYHPVHLTLLCIELHAFPEAVSLVHRTSAAGAVLAVVLGLVWVSLARVLGFGAFAALIGLVWAFAHPTAVELWTNAASHKDLLGLIFFVSAIAVSRLRPSGRGAAWIPVLVLLAGASKSAYATAGLVILGDELLRRRASGTRVSPYTWVSALVAVAWLGGALLVARAERLPNLGWPHFDAGLVGSTATAYLRLLAWPTDLVPVVCLSPTTSAAGLGFLALGGLVSVALRRESSDTTRLGSLVALLGILPFLNLIPTPLLIQLRYTTLPLLGLGIFVGGLVSRSRSPGLRWGFALLSALLVVQLVRAAEPWQRRRSLWEETARVSGDCREPTPWLNLATARVQDGDWRGGESALARAVQAAPEREKTLRDWWLLILLRGSCGTGPMASEEAVHLARTLPLDPAQAEVLPPGLRPSFVFLSSCRASAGQPSRDALRTEALAALRACDPERATVLESVAAVCSASTPPP